MGEKCIDAHKNIKLAQATQKRQYVAKKSISRWEMKCGTQILGETQERVTNCQ